MSDGGRAPLLIELLFGEAAEIAQRAASDRLERWASAFDAWREARSGTGNSSMRRSSRLAWQRLFRCQRKMPWEYTSADLEQHAAWLKDEGYRPTTIETSLGILASFYRWCAQRQVDPACGDAFNPVEGVARPRIRPYVESVMWSRGEVQALLDVLQSDPTPLGKRELAFFLSRIRLGVPTHRLISLQWVQIEQEGGERRVRWRPDSEPARLPPEVWEGIQGWLRASGRLERMEAGSFVFAPLADVLLKLDNAQPEAWAQGRALSTNHILRSLKLYGRAAGIDERKLTLRALRRTATRLKLEEGMPATQEGLREMKSFLDSQESLRATRYRLRRLPELDAQDTREARRSGTRPEPPSRDWKPFQPGDGLRHGFYAHDQPPEEVQAVLSENIRGLEEEIVGLRGLARELLSRQAAAHGEEALLLGQAYLLLATKIARMIETERREAKDREQERWGEALPAALDRMEQDLGRPGVSEEIKQAAGQAELDAAARGLAEEIAAARCILRRTLALAQEAHRTKELLNLAEIYGMQCSRLARLVQAQGACGDALDAFMRGLLEQALEQAQIELNIYV